MHCFKRKLFSISNLCMTLLSYLWFVKNFKVRTFFKELTGQASDYINSVNIVYGLLRTRLSERAHKGQLSAKQTITAKKIIHNLNKESVETMVQLLQLNSSNMAPEELVNLIKTKRTNGSITDETELKIKEVVYFKKLYAIKSLVLLLHMDRNDIKLPQNAPKDLIEVIFTPIFDDYLEEHPHFQPEVSKKSLETPDKGSGNSGDFFCMPCFHEAYTKWKRENNIEEPWSMLRVQLISLESFEMFFSCFHMNFFVWKQEIHQNNTRDIQTYQLQAVTNRKKIILFIQMFLEIGNNEMIFNSVIIW